mmetsp:Transcript_28434/g.69003  ORF Transcript_28434/g.69003 Transcript_28434/m.69003 type:complete len:96 (+) Transcript_28434:258-545(+)
MDHGSHFILFHSSSSSEFNGLSNTIPSEIGRMDALDTLYLQNNVLTGKIPGALFNVDTLKWLHLDQNKLSGTLKTKIGAKSDPKKYYFHLESRKG